ncbi:MAG: cytochrome P450 [Caldilineaceae bacterium]
MITSTSNIQSIKANNAPAPLPTRWGLPLVGVLPQLLMDPFGYIVRSWEQFGDIYALNLGFIKILMLNHPRHAQYVMRDNAENYYKGGPIWDSLRGFVGNGLVTSDGAFWLRQRRLMQPQFHRQRLAGLTELMVEAIDEALQLWLPAAGSGKPFELNTNFNQLTLRVIAKTLFGTALSAAELDEMSSLMAYTLGYLLTDASTQALPAWLPIPGRRRYRQAIARCNEMIYQIIHDSRQGIGPENHLLAMLLNLVDEETGEAMDDRQLRDELATLFLAGYETTSIALTWAMHQLMQHPDVLAKVQAEADSVLGDRLPTFADLPNLNYTRMVIQETMRVNPPVFWLPRVAREADEIDGYAVPAGTHVISFTYAYHRHPEFWPNPDQFDPERFTPENAAGRHHFAWIPFGAGQRQCIGRDFAMMEAQLALAIVAQRFQMRPADKKAVQPMLASTLRPRGGLHVYLESR